MAAIAKCPRAGGDEDAWPLLCARDHVPPGRAGGTDEAGEVLVQPEPGEDVEPQQAGAGEAGDVPKARAEIHR
ncbi:MAG: hypothetical protein M5U07_25090 [Xanthobacteraceae bacterium]|nr:hypothetical protein [Xanthobacteraceae bacterium]